MTDITWRTVTLPDATVGVAYEAGLAITGAATALTAASVSSGSLPPGLSLSADKVRITGTVSGVNKALPQTYTFKVTLTDTAGAVQSGSLSITVRALEARADTPFSVQPVAAQMAAEWPLTQS